MMAQRVSLLMSLFHTQKMLELLGLSNHFEILKINSVFTERLALYA